jgi:hypothetical protein
MSDSLTPAPSVSRGTTRAQPLSPSQHAAWNRLWAILLAPVPDDGPPDNANTPTPLPAARDRRDDPKAGAA